MEAGPAVRRVPLETQGVQNVLQSGRGMEDDCVLGRAGTRERGSVICGRMKGHRFPGICYVVDAHREKKGAVSL